MLVLNLIRNEKGIINIASELVKYDKEYDSIVKNQLGNVIVVDNIDTLNRVGKILDYKYRIVSLDGEILYSGGSITGGSFKQNNNGLNDKLRLNELQEKLELTKIELENLNKDYRDFNSGFRSEEHTSELQSPS